MIKCPACQVAVGPHDACCPSCGISLHHETGSSSASRGGSHALAIALALSLVGGAIFLTCSRVVFYRYWMRPAMMARIATPAAGSTILYEDTEAVDEAAEEPQQSAESGEK